MSSDLSRRIPVAIAYVLGIIIMLWLGQISATILLLAFFVLCLTEFVEVSEQELLSSQHRQLTYIINSILIILAIISPLKVYVWLAILALSILFFVVNGLYVIITTKVLYQGKNLWLNALLYIGIPFSLVIWQVSEDYQFPLVLLASFLLIWLNDTGAYFIGRAIGRIKLHPKISPGKTVEGMIGGAVCLSLIAYGIYTYTGVWTLQIWLVFALGIFIFSVVGDLSESAWKRQYGIKDSGTILRGHGGFLDRLDSFIYAAPIVVLFNILINHYSSN